MLGSSCQVIFIIVHASSLQALDVQEHLLHRKGAARQARRGRRRAVGVVAQGTVGLLSRPAIKAVLASTHLS
jgi:hypothetical protein